MFSGRKALTAAVAVAAAALTAAGCGSSSGSPTTPAGGSSSASQKLTIGVLVDDTGAAASTNKSAINGIKAGIQYAARNGYTIKYVLADTQTSPTTALSAAQKLVTQDHVTAVIAQSALTFIAAPYLAAHNVPVIGSGSDGPEWSTTLSMFPVLGALHQTKVATTVGQFFKARGVTTVGTIGYGASPQSAAGAKSSAASAQAAGLKVGYVNAQFPLGSTDVGPVSLAMKDAGVNGVTSATAPNTSFALITALRQQGVDLKAALLPVGYGGDLLGAGPGATAAAQNVYFSLAYEPVEMQSAATKQFVSDLGATGTTGAPTYAEYNGYASIGLLVRGLKDAGGAPSSATLITALSKVHDWGALGLLGGRKIDINDRENIIAGVDNCVWITQFEGSTFRLVAGADPVCGAEVKGVAVS
ncbi:ABC transporter substrate-binding protein [Frankia sp. AgB1.9]|uniref:ABC transporter substrate-binding protein n=1 Tax=unclassified Frankia TaxID=2632575 RepID=UPI0019348EB7|nr:MULTISPECIES: ABC transporter substrate-binding protein [unclassified Frankia]MBL7489959.1 ABC transporter substrate-binding protein [Frankia sp. AgW1.1]MBL7552153.1 ABC transporter substrate-binding protein [Frankia sp. AgB1.9]MBL7625250.1 ABC transporter substrate-binding protein [Frankia sp. AgB1.8]